MTEWPQTEYIEANKLRLDRIGDGIETCFSTEDIEVERALITSGGIPMITLETPDSAEEWLADDPTLSPSEAAAKAAEYNNSVIDRASLCKDKLLALATSFHTGDFGLLKQLLVGSVPPDLLPYSTGEWRNAEYEWYPEDPDSEGVLVQINSIALGSLGVWGSAKQYEVRADDNGLRKTLTLNYLGGELREVEFGINPVQHELISRLVTAFGDDTTQLAVWTSGAFEDEAELDSALAAFAARHTHVPADELHNLLAQVRAEGIAARQSFEIEEPSLLLPDTTQLDEFIALLG